MRKTLKAWLKILKAWLKQMWFGLRIFTCQVCGNTVRMADPDAENCFVCQSNDWEEAKPSR